MVKAHICLAGRVHSGHDRHQCQQREGADFAAMILEIGGWLVVGLEEPIPSMEGHEYRNPLFGEVYVDFGDGVVKNMYYVFVHVYAYAYIYIIFT